MRSEEALLLLGTDGTIQWANGAAATLLGFSQAELRQMALPLLGQNSDATGPVASAFKGILSSAIETAEGDARFPSKTEKRIAVHWKLYALPSEETERRILLSLSETAQASAEGPITSGYRDIFEHAVEGIFRTTLNGQYLEVNPALARMYGYRSSAELMHHLRDLNTQLYVDPQRRTEFVHRMNQNGYVADFESEVFTASGNTIWISEFARTVCSKDGDPLYFEGSVIDITQRKQSEAAVKRSEEKFRHLVEMTSVVPWESEMDSGRFTYVGPQAESFLGYPLEEWYRPGFWQERVHPEDSVWVAIVRGEAIEKRHRFECEYRMIRADQQVIWIREILTILSEEENAQKIGGFMLDVSYRKESEEQLRESQHFIEQIANASPTILYLYDPERRQSMYVSGRVPDILGYSKEALSEMQPFFLLSLAHPEEVRSHYDHLRDLRNTPPDGVIEREIRLRSAAGTWVWLYCRECVFKRDPEGLPVRIVGSMEDITLQRHAIEELETNEALFRRLAESTRVVPFDYDLVSSRFTYVGPQAEELFGYPMQHWYNLGAWLEIIHPDDIIEGTRFASEIVGDSSHEFQTEFRVRTADGRLVWLRQIVHASAEEDQRTHVRGFFLDVTESKMIEQERERSKNELRELAARVHTIREEDRTNVAREIHDELGQELTMFKLDLVWLQTRMGKTVPPDVLAPLSEKTAAMEQRIDSTLQTVRRVLSALRPPLLDELGLADAIEFQATDFARRAALRCDLNIDPVDDLPIDAGLAVFRIFQEITTNIARHAKATRMSVDLRTAEGKAVLTVADNGRGISEKDKAKKGHFGLIGMRERAWAFGGQLSIDGAPGKGTTVTVEFPLPAVVSRGPDIHIPVTTG